MAQSLPQLRHTGLYPAVLLIMRRQVYGRSQAERTEEDSWKGNDERITMKIPIQDKIDNGVLSAIGLAIVTSSAVHHALAMQLLRILYPGGSDENTVNAFVITSGMKVDTLLGLLKSLVTLRHPQIADEFTAAADALRVSYVNKRDVLAHQAFGNIEGKPDRVRVIKIKTVGRLRFSEYDLTEKEIRKWAREFWDQARKLDSLLTSAGVANLRDLRQHVQSKSGS